jgi:CheY-like chemotaxis protein
MPDKKTRVLIADDELSVRMSISQLLTEVAYRARTAEDGFSALIELRKEVPDILLSDLNMPNMSGYELLSVVRRRFPAIQTIAMSGAFQGNEVPSGVAADAFYQKGSSMGSLLRILGALPNVDRVLPNRPPSALAPIWIQSNGHDNSGEPYVMICCTECLRTFPQALGGSVSAIREADCIYCHSLIHYAIVQPAERAPAQVFQRRPDEGLPKCANAAQFYN